MKPIMMSHAHAGQPLAQTLTLDSLLTALRVFAPPSQIVHVGLPQTPEATVWTQWPIKEAWLIDADGALAERYQSKLGVDTVCHIHKALVSDRSGTANYFIASNPAENSLVDPNHLRMVWPSLALSHRQSVACTTIDEIINQTYPQPNHQSLDSAWLIVDCFPACRILEGAQHLLNAARLVCVRVLSEPGFRGEPSAADLHTANAWMTQRGFSQVAFAPGLNPKVGHAIYGRSVEIDNAQQRLLQDDLVSKDQTIQALTGELERLQHALSDASKPQMPNGVSQEEHVRALDELNAVSAALEISKSEIAEASIRIENKESELAELTKKLHTYVDEQIEIESLRQALKDAESKNDQLHAENQALAHRQQLMNEELLKLEGQISLISDLLLREQGI